MDDSLVCTDCGKTGSVYTSDEQWIEIERDCYCHSCASNLAGALQLTYKVVEAEREACLSIVTNVRHKLQDWEDCWAVAEIESRIRARSR